MSQRSAARKLPFPVDTDIFKMSSGRRKKVGNATLAKLKFF